MMSAAFKCVKTPRVLFSDVAGEWKGVCVFFFVVCFVPPSDNIFDMGEAEDFIACCTSSNTNLSFLSPGWDGFGFIVSIGLDAAVV
jgi:hypothetical protein